MFSLTFIKHDNTQQDLFCLIILRWRRIVKGRIIKNICPNKGCVYNSFFYGFEIVQISPLAHMYREPKGCLKFRHMSSVCLMCQNKNIAQDHHELISKWWLDRVPQFLICIVYVQIFVEETGNVIWWKCFLIAVSFLVSSQMEMQRPC